MNKSEFIEKIDQLVDAHFMESIKDHCISLFWSGAVETDNYEDNFRLPKNILTVVLEHTSRQYSPPISSGRFTKDWKDIKNLRKF